MAFAVRRGEMYKSMRFNDKELSYFALNLVPDKEGTLEKKGAVRGQGEVAEQHMKPLATENVSCTANAAAEREFVGIVISSNGGKRSCLSLQTFVYCSARKLVLNPWYGTIVT